MASIPREFCPFAARSIWRIKATAPNVKTVQEWGRVARPGWKTNMVNQAKANNGFAYAICADDTVKRVVIIEGRPSWRTTSIHATSCTR